MSPRHLPALAVALLTACSADVTPDPGAAGSGGNSAAAGVGGAGGGGGAGTSALGGSASGSGSASGGGSGGGAGGSGGGGGSGGSAGMTSSPFANFATAAEIAAVKCGGAGCHGGETPPYLLDPTTLYATLTTHVSSLCGNRKLVQPGAPQESAFYLALAGLCGPMLPRMPLGCVDTCVPDDYVEGVRQWIASGAKP